MSERKCGSCTMCCKVLGVEPLNKMPGDWCGHCAIGKGCKIYEDRPDECREFECLWLLDDRWPEWARPDKTHVVMSTTLEGDRLIANVDPARPDAYRTGKIGDMLQKIASGIDVIVVIGDKRRILTTPDREAEVRRIVAEGERKFNELRGKK